MNVRKPQISDADRKTIINLSAAGGAVDEIAKKLRVDGRIVSGIVSSARRARAVLSTGKVPIQFPSKDDQLKALAKAWKESEPEEEFSMHTEKGQVIYIACYKGGLVVKVGEQKKVAFLTSGMGLRLGGRLIDMAQLAGRIR